MRIYCATSNPGKLSEFRLAAPGEFEIEPLPGLDAIPPCKEEGSTFEENAIEKARFYGTYCSGYLFAEDSGLEVDALGGAPGVFSARFAGENATDRRNNELLLAALGDRSERTARFVSVIALARDGQIVHTCSGQVTGKILFEPRGTFGFGYDPLFYYEPLACSFGEISPEMKHRVSHRGQALKALFEYLRMAVV